MKKPFFVYTAIVCFHFQIFSQQETINKGEIYAIVVGISKYHYIRPLSYADNDANLFAEFLRSGAGGRIRPENLFILKNDSANAGNFWSALSRINNKKINKGDRVYIFFAGHGDAVKGLNEYYLLLSDCQPANDGNNYMLSFGAIDMYHLKNRVGLLASRGAEVILVLDACRTNELPGGYASQVFSSGIVQAKVGDITMLATAPGQVSIEDASFGNGHGLFTFNLIDALSGRADKEEIGNNDQLMSMEEVQQWVTKQVKSMAEKFKALQNPVFCCEENNKVTIGKIDSTFTITWNRINRANNQVVVPAVKGQRDNVVAFTDTSLLALFNKFNDARKENRLWGDSSANSYYDLMSSRFGLEKITEDARYMLASDFINFAQQKINLYLEGKDLLSVQMMQQQHDLSSESELLAEQYERLIKTLSEKWTIAGLMLEKAGKLLSSEGDSTFVIKLKPKVSFLLARGYVNEEGVNTLRFDEAMQYAVETYRADSTAAYAAECLGLLHAYKNSWNFHFRYHREKPYSPGSKSQDTSLYYFKKAAVLAPEWVNPYLSIAMGLYNYITKDSLDKYMMKAIEANPENGSTYIFFGDALRLRYVDSSNHYYRLALRKTPTSAHADLYRKIAGNFFRFRYPGARFPMMNRDSVMFYSQKALLLDPGNIGAYLNLAGVYGRLKQPDSVYLIYLQLSKVAPAYEYSYRELASYFQLKNKPDSILFYGKKALQHIPNSSFATELLADYFEKKGYADSAIFYYQKGVQGSYPSSHSMERLSFLLMDRNSNDTIPLQYFNYMLNKSPGSWRQYYNIAAYYSNRKEADKAIGYLENALAKGFRNYNQLKGDRYFDFIRSSEPFKKLLEKYFPD